MSGQISLAHLQATSMIVRVSVRRATPEEATDIASVHVRSWQGAYCGLLPQAYLDSLDAAQRVPRWERIIRESDWPRSGTFVALAAPDVVGFVNISPARDEDSDAASIGEVTSIYVLPEAFGQGFGRELMGAALDTLATAGFVQATLWVLDSNVRAARFYAAAGWWPDGATKADHIADTPVTEVRYRHSLHVPQGAIRSSRVGCAPDLSS
jgi:ribosomal protein S18 acetylase RimI-like enzyme